MLSKRIFAAIVMIVILALVIGLDSYVIDNDIALTFLLLSFLLLCLKEFYFFVSNKGFEPFVKTGLIFGALYIFANWLRITNLKIPYLSSIDDLRGVVIFGFVFSCFVAQAFQKDISKTIENVSMTVFGFFYVIYFGAYFMSLRHLGPFNGIVCSPQSSGWKIHGLYAVLACIAVSKFGDISAYFSGRFLGKKKILPKISPKKTWMGFWGGLVGSGAMGALLSISPWSIGPVWVGLAFGVVIGFMAQLGDWGESMIKRCAEIKDSGQSIPGFGGVLDVADSLLLAAPASYYFLHLFKIINR